jgi:hypothetical protein
MITKKDIKDIFIDIIILLGYLRVGYLLAGLIWGDLISNVGKIVSGIILGTVMIVISLYTTAIVNIANFKPEKTLINIMIMLLTIETIIFFIERII